MSMNVLVAVLDHNGANAPLLETACTLATEWTSRLDVLFPYPPVWERDLVAISDEASRYRIQEIEEQARREEEDLVEREHRYFAEACDRFGLPLAPADAGTRPGAQWQAFRNGDRERRVVACARLADLTLMQRPHAATGAAYRSLLNTVLRESGRLLMITPPNGVKPRTDRIAIAWNGSAEAARTVAAAIGLIRSASHVDVLTAESDRTPAAAASGMVAYLAAHDVAATAHVFPNRRNRSVGESVLERCHELGTDLLVMGAYAHARWHDVVFGGVTSHVLRHAEVPALMAH